MSEVVSIQAARSAAANRDARPTGDLGEAYRIVQRGGRTFHVYGPVEDNVFELPFGRTPDGTSGAPPAA